MNEGDICARSHATGGPVRLRWRDGVITSLEAVETEPPRDLWLVPPLLDLQVNGFGGIDFQQDQLTTDDLLRAVRSLRASACTRFLLTLVTDEWPKLIGRLRHLRSLREASDELREAMAGWHVEGPFLSAEPGFCGAHNPAWMCDPTPEHLRELREAAGDDPLLITLAPERLGAIAAVKLAVSLGMKVSLGHTDAPHKRILQARMAGATGFTHLGNGCPRELNRHDNILWRMCETPGLLVSLVPDTFHVSPTLFRLLHRMLGADSIYYISDAMAAAGAPPGRYKLGRLEVEVGEDRIVRFPGGTNFAGSALEPIEGVFHAARMLDCPWTEAWSRFSEAPAKLMGWPAGLTVGGPADFCLLEVIPENQPGDLSVYLRGKLRCGGDVPA